MDINLWKFQGDWSLGVAMTSVQTFSTFLHFTTCAEKMYEQVCQKPERGSKYPFPVMARFKGKKGYMYAVSVCLSSSYLDCLKCCYFDQNTVFYRVMKSKNVGCSKNGTIIRGKSTEPAPTVANWTYSQKVTPMICRQSITARSSSLQSAQTAWRQNGLQKGESVNIMIAKLLRMD